VQAADRFLRFVADGHAEPADQVLGIGDVVALLDGQRERLLKHVLGEVLIVHDRQDVRHQAILLVQAEANNLLMGQGHRTSFRLPMTSAWRFCTGGKKKIEN
jgi:hypothetical protein